MNETWRTTVYCHQHFRIEPIQHIDRVFAGNVGGATKCGAKFSVHASDENIEAMRRLWLRPSMEGA